MPAKIPDNEFPAHFWSRTKGSKGCLLWMKCRWEGYGEVGFRGRVWKTHRVAWVLSNGEIPKGMCVLHTCDNPPCVNPRHLFLGTKADNNKDRERKGRGVYSRGEECSWAKLTWKKVRRIRKVYAAGKAGQLQLAKTYGVDPKAIWQVIHNRSWKEPR